MFHWSLILVLDRIGLKPINTVLQVEKKSEITGIILAGGLNLRMGSNKALVCWRGKYLIDWVYSAICPLCSEIIISANEGDFSHLDAKIVPDRFNRIGPVAGIEAGLSSSKTDLNIIVSCDTPMLTTGFFRYMIREHEGFEISIPVHDGTNEPLIGIYNHSVLSRFQEAIARGQFKPPSIIKSCNYQEVPVGRELNFYTAELFLNLNSPEDLKQ